MDDGIAVLIFFAIAVIGNIFNSIKKRNKKNKTTSKNIFDVFQEKISDKTEYSKKSEYDFDPVFKDKRYQSSNDNPPPMKKTEKKRLSSNEITKPILEKTKTETANITGKTKKTSKMNLKKAVIWSEILKKPVSL